MKRRTFLGATAGIATVGTLTAGPAAAANGGVLENATVTPSGAIVATDDDFVIAGQHLTIAGGTYYTNTGDSYVVYTNGYSGEVRDNTVTVTALSQRTFAIRVDGGDVAVSGNTIDVVDDSNRQFIAISVHGGASSRVTKNAITGGHRVGVLATGAGTTANVAKNDIIGPGPSNMGWADNGVQFSDGATGQIRDNVIDDHWYAPNSFVSSGILAFGDDVVVQRNSITNNDLGVGLSGDRNNVIHNTVSVTYPSTSTVHYGVYELGGVDNGIRQNDITTNAAANGAVGIIVLGDNAKLIRNALDGWQTPILDAGTDTKLPPPFEPAA
jgi:hypothetical protein